MASCELVSLLFLVYINCHLVSFSPTHSLLLTFCFLFLVYTSISSVLLSSNNLWHVSPFPSPSCTSVSGSRLSQTVTVEEDNCCGCNVLAIRRHFLDRALKQVHIVYTSCHDAVSNPAVTGRSGLLRREAR